VKIISCFFCRAAVPQAAPKSKAVLCGNCVQRLTGSPEAIGRAPKPLAAAPKARPPKVRRSPAANSGTKAGGRGRGWHLKKHFVDADGTVYAFGKAVHG
jgi:hypothetical protein